MSKMDCGWTEMFSGIASWTNQTCYLAKLRHLLSALKLLDGAPVQHSPRKFSS
jgi:hypothetical protein